MWQAICLSLVAQRKQANASSSLTGDKNNAKNQVEKRGEKIHLLLLELAARLAGGLPLECSLAFSTSDSAFLGLP